MTDRPKGGAGVGDLDVADRVSGDPAPAAGARCTRTLAILATASTESPPYTRHGDHRDGAMLDWRSKHGIRSRLAADALGEPFEERAPWTAGDLARFIVCVHGVPRIGRCSRQSSTRP